MNLTRFLDAQAPLYATALAELQAGHKRTHWIWFVLPQLRGLGTSHNATYYGIEDAAEAAAYLAHPVLGTRLRECVAAIMSHKGKSAHAILGSPDDAKFRSCLTLFAAVVAQRAPAASRLCAQNPLRSEAGAAAPTTFGFPPSARAVAAPDDRLWQNALDQFYAGEADPATLRLLGA